MVKKIRSKGIRKWIKVKNERNHRIDSLSNIAIVVIMTLIYVLLWVVAVWLLFYVDNAFLADLIPLEDRGAWISTIAIFITLPITIIGIIFTMNKK